MFTPAGIFRSETDNSESAEFKPARSQLPDQPSASDHLSGLNMAPSVGDDGELSGKGKEEVRCQSKRSFSLLLTPSNRTHGQL